MLNTDIPHTVRSLKEVHVSKNTSAMIALASEYLPPDPRHGDMADQASASHLSYLAVQLAPITEQRRREQAVLANPEKFASILGKRCEACRRKISEARLRAVPLTTFCINCEMEHHQK